jgi:hypothetical protein
MAFDQLLVTDVHLGTAFHEYFYEFHQLAAQPKLS